MTFKKKMLHLAVKFSFAGLLLGTLSISNALALTPEQLKTQVESQQQAYLETLKALVNIESGSKDVEGTQALAQFAVEQFKHMGVEASIIPVKDIYKMGDTPEQIGPMVKAVVKGKGKSKIMLIAHMDTVYPRGMIQQQPFKIDGNKAYGLGILDDKQGVAATIHIVKLLKQLDYQKFASITVLLNSDEEISSPGSRAMIAKTAADQDVVFSFEGSGLDGGLRLATSGIGAAYLDVKGKASHAGVRPEAGINALTELTHQLQQLQDLSQPDTGFKLNWTIASAGQTRNVIPEHATAQADARALKAEDFAHLEKTLQQRIQNKKLADSQVSVKFELRRPPLVANDAALKLTQQAQRIYKDELNLDLKVSAKATGGGTDAAFAGMKSKAAVVEGMGLQGDGAHSNNAEYVLVDSIVPRLYLATRLIMQVSESK